LINTLIKLLDTYTSNKILLWNQETSPRSKEAK